MNYRICIPLTQAELNDHAGWVAGFYYIRNCLNSLSLLPPETVPPICIFLPESFNQQIIYPENAANTNWLTVKRIPDNTPSIDKDFNEYFNKESFDIIFPLTSIPSFICSASAIGWIPDFQHKHQPHFFAAEEIQNRNMFYDFLAGICIRIICSSKTVADDFKTIYPSLHGKASILKFRAVIPQNNFNTNPYEVIQKLSIPKRFIYLPNQFWVHKNHRTVFSAWKILKDMGLHIPLICTGSNQDYRFPGYYKELESYIQQNDLTNLITILGKIDRQDQLNLFRISDCVLQPSLFEGWSTSIEESRVFGKHLIVSDIPVHREQCESTAIFFTKDSPDDLANVIAKKWKDSATSEYNQTIEQKAYDESLVRTKLFGKELIDIFNKAAAFDIHSESIYEKHLMLSFISKCNEDRAARLKLIHEQAKTIRAYESQLFNRIRIFYKSLFSTQR